MLPIAARAATKFSGLVVCRALSAISYRLTAQNFFAKCKEVTDKASIPAGDYALLLVLGELAPGILAGADASTGPTMLAFTRIISSRIAFA